MSTVESSAAGSHDKLRSKWYKIENSERNLKKKSFALPSISVYTVE